MYNHAPESYACPFCILAKGDNILPGVSGQSDIFYRDAFLTAFIPLHTWPNNPGNAIIIPNAHYENLYDLPDEIGGLIFALSRRVALAMKNAYGCAGISTRQHNEPAGNQDVWHYHLHIFPRYPDDGLYGSRPVRMTPEERSLYADKLRPFMA